MAVADVSTSATLSYSGCYNPLMIIDSHVHLFPPEAVAHRERFLAADRTFGALYANPKARLATPEELVERMDAAGIDLSVAVGIGWEKAQHCALANDAIAEAVRHYPTRLAGFGVVNPRHAGAVAEVERIAKLGLRGVGELHPDSQGYALDDARVMAPVMDAARRLGLAVLVHASEPVGHAYAGKGTVTPDVLVRFIARFPENDIVCAHWGGGLPFYALMPEVRRLLARVWFDSAATPFLYQPDVFRLATELLGAERVLFGSDYPLLGQERVLAQALEAGLPAGARRLVLGENARKLLGLEKQRRGMHRMHTPSEAAR